MKSILQVLLLIILCTSCHNTESTGQTVHAVQNKITPGAERLDLYGPILHGHKLGLIVNQTSMVKDNHLVDFLQSKKLDLVRIFSPEHGFRGKADAGEQLGNAMDEESGLPIISLYGKNKKPKSEHLKGIDMLVFDIQDVGVRFYTYISTLHYVMEAAAEANIPVVILDRPNPLCSYIDGPVLEKEFTSFVGMHPVPVVYGMTIGEYGQMINGEGWLKDGKKCNLHVVELEHYKRQDQYVLPIKPSPNLPNNIAIGHYPSLCFFEGTAFSIGRGTDQQFQVIGHPDNNIGDYTFTPVPKPGAKYPKHENKVCKGLNLSNLSKEKVRQKAQLQLGYLIDMYQAFPDKTSFFNENNFFDLLAGNTTLQAQIKAGKTEEEIRESWQEGLNNFKKMRKKYLLYP